MISHASVNAADITSLTATELAQMIQAREASSSEIVDAHIRRIEEVNPRINALVAPLFEQARREAQAAVSVKRRSESDDSPMVSALRAAGRSVPGKTNAPQTLLGTVNNPWDLTRTPDGGSGGEGAIVEAGGSPLGLGSDRGGSARIPAAWRRVYTLKPTARRKDRPERTAGDAEQGSAGLPVGLQVAARHWREDIALAIMAALESHFRRRPDYPSRPLAETEPLP